MTPPPRRTVAAFDVDGTLTTHDCVVPFLRRFGGRPSVVARAARQLPSVLAGVARRDRDRLRLAATAAVLGGVALDTLEREAVEFARQVVADRLRPDTTARLRWHLQQDHHVVLVSASYEVYLAHVGRSLGAHGVLATRLEVDPTGACTGRLVGSNCRAAEKVRRLTSWLDEGGLARDDIVLWAYGDSSGDRELLAFADHAVWVTEPLDSVAPSL